MNKSLFKFVIIPSDSVFPSCVFLRYFYYSDLVIIDRKKLKDCKDLEKSANIKGMIVIDDEQEGCNEGFNDMLKFECFRPSYKTSDIT